MGSEADQSKIACACPSKLNLALSVGSAGEDFGGLHPIASWMVAVDLCDDLEITRLSDDHLSRYAVFWADDALVKREIDWSVRDDLAVRAHLALENRVRRRLPVQMKLSKRIPVGGGLGGGSSDAAAMLRAGNLLFELGLTDEDLADIGAGLGSDVPFFVTGGGSALVEGAGSLLSPTHASDEDLEIYAAVVLPDAMCSSAEVYRSFKQSGDGGVVDATAVRSLVASSKQDGLRHVHGGRLFNDLVPAVGRSYPAVAALMSELSEAADGPVHVSGSGSSLFAICDDAMHAEYLARAMGERVGLPSIAVRSLGVTALGVGGSASEREGLQGEASEGQAAHG